ncbi:hypothetical protein NDU88_004418 [Pleurodeles waltl]|uniref:Uncharacterized protein n=1 Tax=Pleurodeles waltl TaxID=8319 RepID=A0AAV7NML8_PLEWA|nr:hypothetical protein NDU88_004418 [Pleurodeles waltl]
MRVRLKRSTVRAQRRQLVLRGGCPPARGDRLSRPVLEYPRLCPTRPSSGSPPRGSSEAPGWCEAPGRSLGGPGTPSQVQSAREPMPRRETLGGSRSGCVLLCEMAPPPDGAKAPRSPGFLVNRSQGAPGHPVRPGGQENRIGCSSGFGRMTEGSRALSECDRHLDAHSHAPGP